MENINSKFNEELQQQIDGTLPKGHVYSLGYPGENLLSAGLSNLPIELNSERMANKANPNYRRKHPFDLSEVKDLPNAINNPIAVFNSTKNDGAKIILTSLQHNGNNFVIVMKIQKKGRGRGNKEINDIRSIYPKDNITDLMHLFKSGNRLITWLDKEKALNFVSVQSTNLIGNGNKIQGSIINIVNNFENVK